MVLFALCSLFLDLLQVKLLRVLYLSSPILLFLCTWVLKSSTLSQLTQEEHQLCVQENGVLALLKTTYKSLVYSLAVPASVSLQGCNPVCQTGFIVYHTELLFHPPMSIQILYIQVLLLCLLVIDPVCSTTFSNKLQMDPLSVKASLQKTLSTHDPAALHQLTTELSAKANQLAVHHHQLARLTTLTEELVDALRSIRLSTPDPALSQPSMNALAPPTSSINPRLALPDKFDGNPMKCKGFLLQCSLFVNQQPTMYITDTSKTSFVCSLFTDMALEWATAVWREDGSTFP